MDQLCIILHYFTYTVQEELIFPQQLVASLCSRGTENAREESKMPRIIEVTKHKPVSWGDKEIQTN